MWHDEQWDDTAPLASKATTTDRELAGNNHANRHVVDAAYARALPRGTGQVTDEVEEHQEATQLNPVDLTMAVDAMQEEIEPTETQQDVSAEWDPRRAKRWAEQRLHTIQQVLRQAYDNTLKWWKDQEQANPSISGAPQSWRLSAETMQLVHAQRERNHARKYRGLRITARQRRQNQEELKLAIRRDHQRWWEQTIQDLEAATAEHRDRDAQQILRKLRRHGRTRRSGGWADQPTLGIHGRPMLSMEEKAGEWRTYMAELAQGTPAEEQRAQWPQLHDVSEADHHLGRDELEDVFRKIKYGKAVPTDGIAIEAYKASPVAKEALFDLVAHCWRHEAIPDVMTTGVQILLWKRKKPKD